MARRTNVKIVDIEPEFKKSQWNDKDFVKVVSAQEYDNKNKSLHLSLNTKNPRRVAELEKIIEVGGCYSVVIAEKVVKIKSGKTKIHEYIDFLGVVKKLPTNVEAKNQQQELITKDNIAKSLMDDQLKKISKFTFEVRKYVNGIDEVVAVLHEDYKNKL